ncbi:uncharacterized protein LOC131591686 [Poecile atricapillus]|uniref:uncharacterized protein LOC131591686 n=1 Tax=Poecile atricapillus TaxID=48891 RepID=UPI002739BD81|nr:uncharacterized protein LOC131591686 [Poecile atricapillus]
MSPGKSGTFWSHSVGCDSPSTSPKPAPNPIPVAVGTGFPSPCSWNPQRDLKFSLELLRNSGFPSPCSWNSQRSQILLGASQDLRFSFPLFLESTQRSQILLGAAQELRFSFPLFLESTQRSQILLGAAQELRFSFPLSLESTEISNSPWSCSGTQVFLPLVPLESRCWSFVLGAAQGLCGFCGIQMLQSRKSSRCSTLREPHPSCSSAGDAAQESLSAPQCGSSCPGGFGIPSLGSQGTTGHPTQTPCCVTPGESGDNRTSHTNSLLCHPWGVRGQQDIPHKLLVVSPLGSQGTTGQLFVVSPLGLALVQLQGMQRNSQAPVCAQVTLESSCPGNFRGWASEVSLSAMEMSKLFVWEATFLGMQLHPCVSPRCILVLLSSL